MDLFIKSFRLIIVETTEVMKSLSRYIIMEEKIQKMIMINHVNRNNGRKKNVILITAC